MHIDARELRSGSVIEGDICIVGAGAAGLSIALEWINSPHKIILLEGGGFEYDEKVQDLYDGKTTGQHYFPLRSARLHYFGGTTGHWAGYCSTMDEIDFQKRDWVPYSGWPITRKDLDPFYARAQENVELGPYEYNLDYWQKKDPDLIPLPLDKNVVWNKIWQFSPPTRFGPKYRKRIEDAKNIQLYTYANLTDIISNENVSAVKQVTVKNHAGKEHTVHAKYFILACGAIQNARILLASNKQAPQGLGNDQGLVGRFFMEHLEIKSGELWLDRPNSMKLYMMDFGRTKMRSELAISAEKQREFKILNGTVSLSPLATARNTRPIIDVWTGKDPRKDIVDLYQNFRKSDHAKPPAGASPIDKAFQLFTRVEQAPNPSSRITLDTEKDSLGMPRSILNWILTPLEKKSIRKIDELIGQQAGLAGVARVKLLEYLWDENDYTWPSFTGGGWHHMGTTRMSEDSKAGVVDADCRVHGIANLYVAGSSCFVTAAAPNPTLTLIALSIRLSDHLKGKLKRH